MKIWAYPLFDVDEPRYAEAAREMWMHHGDWITPHFNFVVRFDKPVLFYWLIAGLYKVFGVSAGAARLVSVIAGMMTAWMLSRTMHKATRNPLTGFLTAAAFVTMAQAFVLSRWAITDMTLTACMTGTWLGLYGVLSGHSKCYYWAGLAGGLGLLTKGPVAIALPGLTFLIYLVLYHRQAWRSVIDRHLLGGVLLGLIIALPWYTAVTVANPHTFIQQFFLLHNVERFSATVSGHTGGPLYYIPVILGGFMPWMLFLPAIIACLWQTRTTWPPVVRYAHVWFWVVVLFFSVAHTKLLTYVLPAFPAMAIMLAWTLTSVQAQKISRAWWTWPVWFTTGLLLALVWFLAFKHPHFAPVIQAWWPHPEWVFAMPVILLAAVFAVVLRQLSRLKNSIAKAAWYLAGGMAIVYLTVAVFILPGLAHMFQSELVAYAHRAVRDNVAIATFNVKKPSLVFYTGRKVYFLADTPTRDNPLPSATPLPVAPYSMYVVVKTREANRFQARFNGQLITSGLVYNLYKVTHPQLDQDLNQ